MIHRCSKRRRGTQVLVFATLAAAGTLLGSRVAGAPGLPGAAASQAVAGARPSGRAKADPVASRPSATPEAAPSASAPAAVGALFPSGGSEHYCSGSVVWSVTGDVVLTAAHCVAGTGTGLVFVPGYDDGHEPYGQWKVVAAYAAPAWLSHQDPEDDFAFLVVAPHIVAGKQVTLQQLTGAYQLGNAPPSGSRVTVVAYPAGADDPPVRCVPLVYWTGGFPGFDCGGYPGGTSGGPWLRVTQNGPDTVEGLIGGLHQGGCLNSVSYSPVFGPTTRAIYEEAVDRDNPDTLPTAGPSGC